ncbi:MULTISPECIES: membrane protein insertase YidC [unclassified Brevundimonas]|uniref:membrane protein insertase YidC n=1 Tax=unclassified Brevundimonas TaxID=2622653 RepID=UPI000CFBFABB|nr:MULTISPECIES: membrane protein insertase YidC [unclassified Brevundimonas]PRA31109.1 membrane protein insertase YidC [Brevundimonas sp. MYb27]PQZ81406.1 membrane protein insertase YidC [Brevundimonas sp. MYb31]PRB12603.1 membrane protein insertase YidC [Brevundimonas sp. MYb52]PRB33437.1 membrane protein insertase YidC [Brevundimonas sp. MYb46]PRB51309.1 membrane protein insertase YidC [Brevundimonas sp. MYb33]
MQNENSRNTIIFFVCAALIMGVYYFMVMRPQAEMRRQQQVAAAEAKAATATDAGLTSGSAAPAAFVSDRAQALGTAARVPIQTATLKGSLSLQGARIDDLYLTDYKETLDKNSPPVELFRPQGMEHAYFAQFGWSGPNVPGGVPGPNTVWSLTKGASLTPTTPVELTWDNGAGLRFTRVIAIDAQYVFTVTDTVANLSGQPITIAPYGRVERQGVPTDLGKQMILHEGAIGTFGANGKFTTEQVKYKDWAKKPRIENQSTGGWLGITDKYWMAALIPDQKEAIEGRFAVRDPDGLNVHEAAMLGATRTIQPGRQIEETQRLFAGAKRNEILAGYEKSLDLPRFVYAIDWGHLFFLTRPIFMIVEFFYGVLGNFGLAILALTVVVKLIMFPLANKSYESLSKMRTLQPKMEEIKKKFKDDPQKQQQETMALYQREKINPLAGCLPIVVQIPVFYALYKVLFVTIEMRHAPFFGWIRDLSARDPSTIWNLFGAIPWDPATLPLVGSLLNGPLHLGVLPIVYGLTMWLQQSMNPPAQDPMQRQIFAFLPFIFTFIMAPFAAGLLIYWAWNNILSIAQQYVIMHRFKAENPIDTFFARFKKA